MMKRSWFSKQIFSGYTVLLIVFAFDMFIKPGMALGALYALAIYMVLKEKQRVIRSFAFVSILLLIFKTGWYYPDISFVIICNRLISIIVIAVIAIVAIKRKDLFDKRNREREEYINFLEELITTTSHKVRGPVNSCMGLVEFIQKEKELAMSDEELKKIFGYLKTNATDLDTYTRGLTETMHRMKKLKESKKGSAISP